MSGEELAPFVAAALRDRVVTDLQKELQELKAKYQAVELSGKGGFPVYASKSFSTGAYSSPLEWTVDVSDTSKSTCGKEQLQHHLTVGDLTKLEVRLGGITRGVWHLSCREGLGRLAVYNNNGFAENLAFCFGMEAGLYVVVDVEMNQETFKYLTAKDSFGDELVESTDLPNMILQLCPEDAKVRLRNVVFFTDKIEAAMRAWNIPPFAPGKGAPISPELEVCIC
ncbi:expressed unknown protein [Seminavis robusta]|uniref:Uncharacterized protein n=1 Tax=Seminavis robusta TaxID=568900 RepID=A0A9N8DAT6_9STRA|nr:expressed unknown protein [Seminavis robusta]|eukprot:Sro3_g002850.1 n/a (225) ;mRNA; f:257509-258183